MPDLAHGLGLGIYQSNSISAKLLGLCYSHAMTSIVWGYSIGPQFPVRNYSVTPRDKGILTFSHFLNYFSNV